MLYFVSLINYREQKNYTTYKAMATAWLPDHLVESANVALRTNTAIISGAVGADAPVFIILEQVINSHGTDTWYPQECDILRRNVIPNIVCSINQLSCTQFLYYRFNVITSAVLSLLVDTMQVIC